MLHVCACHVAKSRTLLLLMLNDKEIITAPITTHFLLREYFEKSPNNQFICVECDKP